MEPPKPKKAQADTLEGATAVCKKILFYRKDVSGELFKRAVPHSGVSEIMSELQFYFYPTSSPIGRKWHPPPSPPPPTAPVLWEETQPVEDLGETLCGAAAPWWLQPLGGLRNRLFSRTSQSCPQPLPFCAAPEPSRICLLPKACGNWNVCLPSTLSLPLLAVYLEDSCPHPVSTLQVVLSFFVPCCSPKYLSYNGRLINTEWMNEQTNEVEWRPIIKDFKIHVNELTNEPGQEMGRCWCYQRERDRMEI